MQDKRLHLKGSGGVDKFEWVSGLGILNIFFLIVEDIYNYTLSQEGTDSVFLLQEANFYFGKKWIGIFSKAMK